MRFIRGVDNTLYEKEMPCACQLPPEIYPDAAEWGPILWNILHGTAERVGTAIVKLYQNDERYDGLMRYFFIGIKTIPIYCNKFCFWF